MTFQPRALETFRKPTCIQISPLPLSWLTFLNPHNQKRSNFERTAWQVSHRHRHDLTTLNEGDNVQETAEPQEFINSMTIRICGCVIKCHITFVPTTLSKLDIVGVCFKNTNSPAAGSFHRRLNISTLRQSRDLRGWTGNTSCHDPGLYACNDNYKS